MSVLKEEGKRWIGGWNDIFWRGLTGKDVFWRGGQGRMGGCMRDRGKEESGVGVGTCSWGGGGGGGGG